MVCKNDILIFTKTNVPRGGLGGPLQLAYTFSTILREAPTMFNMKYR